MKEHTKKPKTHHSITKIPKKTMESSDLMRNKLDEKPKTTLREQLVSQGLIKPVETFRAIADELHAKVLAADEARRKKVKRKEEAKRKKTLKTKEHAVSERPTTNKIPHNSSSLINSEKNKGIKSPQASKKKFKCSICNQWIPLGQGLKHEAMHNGTEYFPRSHFRYGHTNSGTDRISTTWVHVYQGGLPGLGKRR